MSGGEMPKYAKISIKATNIKLHLMQIKAPHALYQHNAHIFQNSQPTEASTTILAPGFVYPVCLELVPITCFSLWDTKTTQE